METVNQNENIPNQPTETNEFCIFQSKILMMAESNKQLLDKYEQLSSKYDDQYLLIRFLADSKKRNDTEIFELTKSYDYLREENFTMKQSISKIQRSVCNLMDNFDEISMDFRMTKEMIKKLQIDYKVSDDNIENLKNNQDGIQNKISIIKELFEDLKLTKSHDVNKQCSEKDVQLTKETDLKTNPTSQETPTSTSENNVPRKTEIEKSVELSVDNDKSKSVKTSDNNKIVLDMLETMTNLSEQTKEVIKNTNKSPNKNIPEIKRNIWLKGYKSSGKIPSVPSKTTPIKNTVTSSKNETHSKVNSIPTVTGSKFSNDLEALSQSTSLKKKVFNESSHLVRHVSLNTDSNGKPKNSSRNVVRDGDVKCSNESDKENVNVSPSIVRHRSLITDSNGRTTNFTVTVKDGNKRKILDHNTKEDATNLPVSRNKPVTVSVPSATFVKKMPNYLISVSNGESIINEDVLNTIGIIMLKSPKLYHWYITGLSSIPINTTVFSPAFIASKFKYKIQLLLVRNLQNGGKDLATICFQIVPGPFDESNEWPFSCKLELSLVEPLSGKSKFIQLYSSKNCNPYCSPRCFERPSPNSSPSIITRPTATIPWNSVCSFTSFVPTDRLIVSCRFIV